MTLDLSHMDKIFRRQILWCCSDPRYGWSEREIEKELELPSWAKPMIRDLMDSYRDNGWVKLKLDDDDGYWWTTDEGIEQLKIRTLHGGL